MTSKVSVELTVKKLQLGKQMTGLHATKKVIQTKFLFSQIEKVQYRQMRF